MGKHQPNSQGTIHWNFGQHKTEDRGKEVYEECILTAGVESAY
jgi:hypothetical protein